MELPIQNLMSTSPALDKTLSEGPGLSNDANFNKAEYDASFTAETKKADEGSSHGVQFARHSDEAGSPDFFSNGYAQNPNKGDTRNSDDTRNSGDTRNSADAYSSERSHGKSEFKSRSEFNGQSGSRGRSEILAQGSDARDTRVPANGYRSAASDSRSEGYTHYTTNRTETDDSRSGFPRELNIYQFANEQASGQLRDPEAALLSNPGELVNQSFQSISYFIDRDLQTQHRLMKSQTHDVSSAFESNPFIVSGNQSVNNLSVPVSYNGDNGYQPAAGDLVTSESNNSKTGKVDEQLRGLASYMSDVMLFSYQATLISKVSQSFSSSVSTLMRGQ